MDTNSLESVRATLRDGDVVVDAAGPFQDRTLTLIEAAVEIGFDVIDLIDLNDNIAYGEKLIEKRSQIEASGIRVLPSCSSVSAISAWVIGQSGIAAPKSVVACIVPSTRRTAGVGTAASLLHSVGRPVRCWRQGRWATLKGWRKRWDFSMPPPLERIRGHLFESADALWLPRAWASLATVETYVDSRTPGLNAVLAVAARAPAMRNMMARALPWGTRLARLVGSKVGGLAYEIESVEGETRRYAVTAARQPYLAAVAPAVIAARSIAGGSYARRGWVPPHEQIEPTELRRFLETREIKIQEL